MEIITNQKVKEIKSWRKEQSKALTQNLYYSFPTQYKAVNFIFIS
jgi:hypothetical protein